MTALPYDAANPSRGRRPLLRKTTWWRTAGFLLVNLIVFLVACAFWRYLATGHWIDFSPAAYLRDLRLPVGEVFFRPLGVLEHPWLIVVASLTLATIVLLPVTISLMFPMRYTVVFALAVGVVAHMPGLAAAGLLGGLLAARTPLRSDMPFAASLLGLSPMAVYLSVMGFLGVNTVTVSALQRWVLYAPLVLAMAFALTGAAGILIVARVLRFRPGAIWPMAILMVAGAILTFFVTVGPDEMAYALIAHDTREGTALIAPRPLEPWRKANASGLSDAALLNRVNDDLDARRADLANRCREFLDRYGRTRRAAEVLWIQAQTASLRIDQHAYAGNTPSGQPIIAYVSDPPTAASEELYQRLRIEHAGTGQAALALLRLAQLALQSGDVTAADEHLVAARQRLTAVVTAMSQRVPRRHTARIFRDRTELPSPTCYAHALLTANRLAWSIETNDLVTRSSATASGNTVDAQGAAVLQQLASLDPHRLDYVEQLHRLTSESTDTALADEVQLTLARAVLDSPSADPEARREALTTAKALATRRTGNDAFLEANDLLGHLALQRLPGLEAPETYFRVVADQPANPWQSRAIQALALLTDRSGLSR